MSAFDVKIKSTSGGEKLLVVRTAKDAKISELKEAISEKANIPAKEQRLIYKGQVLKDDRTVDSYGIKEDHVLHMVRSKPPSSAPAATATPVSAQAAPTNSGALGADTGMGPAQQSMMQSMLNNPEMLQSMVRSNPMIQQLIDANPELGPILNDPSALRDAMAAQMNPALAREQSRHQDRQLSNLEAHPEGFNLLRRMYENVQEPMMDAVTNLPSTRATTGETTQPSSGENNSASNPPASPNTAPLPNPWAPTATAGRQGNADPLAASLANLSGLGGPGGAGAGSLFGQGANPFAMPGMGGAGGPMGGSIPPEMLAHLSDPNVRNQLSQFISSDMGQNMLRSALQQNPNMQGMTNDPLFMQMLRDPNFVSQMLSPDTIRQAQNFQRNPNMAFLQGLMQNMQPGQSPAAPQPVANPEETYSSQLSQLQEMGFFDRESNIRALQSTGGNVQAAVDRLLSQPF